MLHAFNIGFYDRDHGAFYDHTGYTIGQELWAFVPHQLLPHLEFLTQVQYVHVYFMDQKPRIFDARIFTADSTHVNGWGTLLIAGMRMGGKTMAVDLNGDGDTTDTGETFRSAYCLFDVTKPLEPKFLGAFTDSVLGLTTSFPAIFRIQDKWFMAVGSGPNGTDAYLGKSAQRGWFYVVEITSSGFNPTITKKMLLPDTETTTFVGDPSVVDLDMVTASSSTYAGGINWSAEALYFGSVYQSATYNASNPVNDSNRQWLGRMYHLRLTSDTSLAVPDPTGTGWSSPVPRLAVSSATIPVGPITAAANVTKDTNGRYWVYFGTGRYFASADIDDTCTQRFFGLKEPIYTSGADLGKPDFGSVTIEADTDLTSGTSKSLFDATNTKVYEGGYVDLTGDGAMEYTAPLGFSTFAQALDTKKNGWLIQTSAGERMLGMPNIIGGISLFTGYIPPAGTQCQYEGTSYLYAPYFKTGTAFRKSVIGLGTDTYSGSQVVQRKTSLGAGVATSPTIHVGDRSKAFIQSSTGTIIDTETATAFPIKSGARSWRTE
jgi:type IV pilus assembly protein PilY1